MKELEIVQLKNEEELLKALGVSELAGGDAPDCSLGVILIRIHAPSPVTGDDLSRILSERWTGDLPVVVVSKSGFAPGALEAASEYEDAHLFASST